MSTYNHQLDSYSLESVIKWDIIEHARKDTFLKFIPDSYTVQNNEIKKKMNQISNQIKVPTCINLTVFQKSIDSTTHIS